jgi:heat shock protein HtpX
VLLLGVGSLLTVTLSRYREYAADRTASLLTGTPEQLMSALQKIAAELPKIPDRDYRDFSALNAFLIVPTRAPRRVEWLNDHPLLEKRLRALESVARDLGKAAA